MENLKNLVGDAAKSIAAQAEGIEHPGLRAQAEKTAKMLSAKARDESIAAARNAPFCRVPLWAFWLPISRRQQLVLGRVYSFQCTTSKDGSPAEYRMSLANGGEEMSIRRDHLHEDLRFLMKLGFVTKRSNGERRPATYLVDEVVCITEARRNGWEG